MGRAVGRGHVSGEWTEPGGGEDRQRPCGEDGQSCGGREMRMDRHLGLVSSVRRAPAFKQRYWVQIPAKYSGWGHYNNVGCSARLETGFKLNPVTEGKQGTFPFLSQTPLPSPLPPIPTVWVITFKLSQFTQWDLTICSFKFKGKKRPQRSY